MRDFDRLSKTVNATYENGKYQEALSLVGSSSEFFPDHAATLTYWGACFKSLLGEPDSALDELQRGLSAGNWWAEPMLFEDPDLRGLRQLDGFANLATESGRRWREAMSGPPKPPIVVPAESDHRATLVVLQGGAGSIDQVVHSWRIAAHLGCTLIVPGRGQPTTSDGGHANWIDEELTDQTLESALDDMERGALLIAGYSAGGRQALRIGLAGSPVLASGLLLFGPGHHDAALDVEGAARRGLRVWTFIGSDDPLLDKVRAVDRDLRIGGIDVLEHVGANVGHVVPDDLAALLPTALDFVLAH